ncbi:MAG: hypothetical protein ACR2NX_09330 [Chthoniobacterales bacterium]
MIEARASKSFASGEAEVLEAASPNEPAANLAVTLSDFAKPSPLVWLNLVCLDAPLVAVSWQWLFSHAFGIPIARGGMAALFLTAWFIYLADRFGDSLSINFAGATSLRQRFCLQHHALWLTAIGVIGLADAFVILTRLGSATFRSGAVVGLLAFGYLALNQATPGLWRRAPLKEIAIGFLFAGGTLVAFPRGLSGVTWLTWLLFACVCSLNCICIAVWERELDLAQARVTMATAFPRIARALLPALALVACSSAVFAIAMKDERSVFVCLTVSAGLLAALHLSNDRMQTDTRTALADLVLLTPMLLLLQRAF